MMPAYRRSLQEVAHDGLSDVKRSERDQTNGEDPERRTLGPTRFDVNEHPSPPHDHPDDKTAAGDYEIEMMVHRTCLRLVKVWK